MSRNILVIKLGALGDFIYALGPMAAIRAAHPGDHITLMTTAPYVRLAKACGYFDDILVDKKPRGFDILGWLALRRRLNNGQFDRVYDLQNNDRTSFYFKLFARTHEWVGAAVGASHRNDSPERSARHAFYGHVDTLKIGGIDAVTLDPLDWMKGSVETFSLPQNYVLFVAGCSPQHPEKRWPVQHFRSLAAKFIRQGITPVLLGTKDDATANAAIARGLDIIDLTGRTDLFDIPALAHGAHISVGNDTGPMHIVAVTGAPFVMLFSNTASNPTLHAPPLDAASKSFAVLCADHIKDISVADVFESYLAVFQNTKLDHHKSG